jgi:hypothetical protein
MADLGTLIAGVTPETLTRSVIIAAFATMNQPEKQSFLNALETGDVERAKRECTDFLNRLLIMSLEEQTNRLADLGTQSIDRLVHNAI